MTMFDLASSRGLANLHREPRPLLAGALATGLRSGLDAVAVPGNLLAVVILAAHLKAKKPDCAVRVVECLCLPWRHLWLVE